MLKKKLGIECIENRINNCHISWFYKVPSTLTIPEGCRRIRSGIFGNCNKLKKVIIPGSVKEIGIEAFWCCRKLEKVVIPESVVEIGDVAFAGCWDAEIILRKPKNEFKYIGDCAFLNCRSVEYAKEETRS